jgi:hypothetical protein
VALTKCHECSREISTSAESCPKCGAKPKASFLDRNIGCGTLIVAVLGVGFLISLFDDRDSSVPSSRSATQSAVGADVVLRVSSGDVVVSVSEDAYAEFLKLAIAEDYLGMARMEAAGRLFRVPSGTKARVIGTGLEKREIRITEGSHFGRAGWVTHSLVQ